jgi:hypothetical protein
MTETATNPLPATVDDPNRLRARAIIAALHHAADHPDVPVWRDPAGDIVGSAAALAAVAVDALKVRRDTATGATPIAFWLCPEPGHSDRSSPDGRPVVTVEWDGDVARCTAPDCGRTNQDRKETP